MSSEGILVWEREAKVVHRKERFNKDNRLKPLQRSTRNKCYTILITYAQNRKPKDS